MSSIFNCSSSLDNKYNTHNENNKKSNFSY